MFVNYFSSEARESPVNLAASRVLLGLYLLWRGGSIDAQSLVEWPIVLYPRTTYLYPPEGFEFVLVLEKWLLVAFALSFLVGYRIRLSAFVASLLMAHLASVMMVVNTSGETEQMVLGSLFVLLFGLYADQDELSIDALRRERRRSGHALDEELTERGHRSHRTGPLKWSLLVLAITYFGAGWSKIVHGPLFSWTAPGSLGRWIAFFHDVFRADFLLGEFLAGEPLLLSLSAWSTIIVEVGFVVAVVLGLSITPVVLFLLGMHAVIVASMGIVFFDMFFFLAMFAAFDSAYAKLVSDRRLVLIYDDGWDSCACVLYLFERLDVNETVTFYPRHDVPETYRPTRDGEFDDGLCVFIDGEPRCGYRAFRELLRQFWITVPLAWITGVPPVRTVGKRIYEYVAESRSGNVARHGESSD